MHTTKRGIALLLLALAGFFAPRLAGASNAVFSACVLIAIFAVMSYGLDLIVSDLGEVSLAHTVFFAVGCYTTALLSTRAGFGGWATLASAIAVALLFAAVLGLVTLRLREFVFSLVTYAIAVVAATVALSDTLEMGIVGEGIETEAQRRALADLGCTTGQGYLFAPPLPGEQAAELLRVGAVVG